MPPDIKDETDRSLLWLTYKFITHTYIYNDIYRGFYFNLLNFKKIENT